MNARPISCSSMSCTPVTVLKGLGYLAVAASVALFVTGLFATGGGTAAIMLSALHLSAKYAIIIGTPGTVAALVLIRLKTRTNESPPAAMHSEAPQAVMRYENSFNGLLDAFTNGQALNWINQGNDVNIRLNNDNGATVLISLVMGGDADLVNRFLDLPGVDVNIIYRGQTALQIARERASRFPDKAMSYALIISRLESLQPKRNV